MNHLEAFRDAIAAAGLTPPSDVIGDGKLHRFSSNGQPRDESGWYKFFDDDRPAGAFGCWRSDISSTWKSSSPQEFTPAEREAYKQRMRDAEAARAAELIAAQAHAASAAATLWAESSPADDHNYLVRKGITGESARVHGDMLLIPVKQGPKQLAGLQRIYPDGSKRFIKGTPLSGGYCTIGAPAKNGVVVICEGYATGASIREATGHCVVVAFNAGNLTNVARKIRAALPAVHIIIAADDDAWTDGNPGITSATEAALAVDALLAVPGWMGDRPEKHTDFNDLHLDEGLRAVADCVDNASEPVPPGGNRLAADQVQHAKPGSGVENPGSDGAGVQPTPSDVAGHQEPGPVILQAPGSVVSNLPPLVDYHGWLPNVNDKGKPLSTIENVDEICRRLGVTVRYNVISKDEEILIPGAGFSLDNKANASLAWLISECAKFRMPVDRVPDFATYLADCNQYNPVAEWVLSKPWDGESRLQSLCETITAVGQAKDPRIEKMKNTFIRRWMISAIAGAFRPTGVSAHGVLVFQGDQYLGKTKWFKTLVPSHLGVLQDGMTLRPDDRDSVKQVVSHWLVELGELDATFRKSDIAALKAFITRDRDVFRRAFARKESEYARRTVFFASVNPREFLHDPTGNRRYWTIECATIDHSHSIDMQQCWAEVYALFAAGESWFLDADEAASLTSNNKNFEVIDPIEEMINGGMLWASPVGTWSWRSATDVLRDLGKRDPTQSECTKASLIIRERNGKQSKRTGSTRQLLVPDLVKASQVSW